MTASQFKSAPEPTLRRLPRYLHLLFRLREGGLEDVSSTLIARELKLDPTQVRKDIEYTDIVGRPKTGYPIEDLIIAIEAFLNWNNTEDAFIAGVGNLGSAMLGYQRFKKYGLNFVAAFDTDKQKIGTQIDTIPVLSIEKLPDLANRMKIKFGVLTVPPQYAQFVAEIMVEGGIKAIWNFAPCQLKLPDDVIVENAQLTQSLAVISRKLHEKKILGSD
ncbi:MAG: redox-sensing transcriptional repressor Rex [Melioribacteraceae bacterium]|nr:redox-sensing transcriptional repressor Rex [Melioribacteraceae bacterium]